MDPHIAQLHEQVIKTDAYKEVKEELDDLKGGQTAMLDEFRRHEAENRDQFDKGAKRMAGIEGKVDDMAKEIQELKTQMTTQHSELLGAIKDKENDRLKSEIKEIMESKKAQDGRIWDIVKIVLAVFIVGGLAAIGIKA